MVLRDEAQRFAELRTILAKLDECAFVIDDDLTIGYATPNVGRVFSGKSFESVEGLPISEVVGTWIQEELPVGNPAEDDSCSYQFRRTIRDRRGGYLSVNVAVEPFRSDFGSLLIRCRRIGEKELKDLAESKRKRYERLVDCLLYTSPSPRDKRQSRMPSSA